MPSTNSRKSAKKSKSAFQAEKISFFAANTGQTESSLI